MHAHLDLGAVNIERTTWLSSEILSTDPLVARAGANKLRHQLVRVRPDAATRYDFFLLNDAALMQQISFMADDPQPECVWRKAGRCAYLFMFLADRFVGAPDTVIDCESIHAQWQRLGGARRGVKLLMLNALIKLRNFYRTHGGLPGYEALEEHIELVRHGLQLDYAAAVAGRVDRRRFWHNVPFRFNMRPMDVPLARDVFGVGEGAAVPVVNNVERLNRKSGNYLRYLFYNHHCYKCTALPGDRYFYVAENKSVAYRDQPRERRGSGPPALHCMVRGRGWR